MTALKNQRRIRPRSLELLTLYLGSLVCMWLAGTMLGVPPTTLAGIGIVWLVFLSGRHSRLKRGPWCEWSGSRRIATALCVALLLALSVSIILRHAELQRDTIDLALLGALWSLVLLQALATPLTKGYRIVTILETVSVSMFSIWSVDLGYPVYNGRIDFLFHSWFSLGVIQTGHVPLMSGYSTFPILHLLTASLSEISGLSITQALTLGVSVALTAILPVLVKLVHAATRSYRAGLIAMVLFASSAEFQMWGRFAAPTTLGFSFALFAFAFTLMPPVTMRRRGMALLFVTTLILTHVLAAALLIILFLLSSLAFKLRRGRTLPPPKRHTFPTNFVTLCVMMILAYWSFVAVRVFQTYVPILSQAVEGASLATPSFQYGLPSSVMSSSYQLVVALTYFAAFSTIFWRYGSRGSSMLKVTMGASLLYPLTLLPLAISSLLLSGLGLAIGRWALFGMPFVAALTSVYLMTLRTVRLRAILVVAIIVAVNLGVAASSLDTSNNWNGSQIGRSTDYFTTSELTAAHFILSRGRGVAATDFIYASLFLYVLNATPSIVSSDYTAFFNRTGIHIVRIDELDRRGLEFLSYQEPFYKVVTVTDVNRVLLDFGLGSRFYDDGRVIMIET